MWIPPIWYSTCALMPQKGHCSTLTTRQSITPSQESLGKPPASSIPLWPLKMVSTMPHSASRPLMGNTIHPAAPSPLMWPVFRTHLLLQALPHPLSAPTRTSHWMLPWHALIQIMILSPSRLRIQFPLQAKLYWVRFRLASISLPGNSSAETRSESSHTLTGMAPPPSPTLALMATTPLSHPLSLLLWSLSTIPQLLLIKLQSPMKTKSK
mmetsp:Transcript_11168/g.15419  ORF Transcript_11168/g.15419 Transcript_11168/m.15419 type:complete len:210 (-) Transcript_11168:1906-2535(-)